MIELSNVTKKYGSFTAIEGINCTIREGSILGLSGHNGSGKTTLLKTVCGVFKQERGSITLDGQEIYDNAEMKGRIFFIPDDPYFLPQSSMARMAKFYRGYYSSWNDRLFKRLASIFKLDTGKRLGGFSKGMLRQASIIFALSASPDYMLIDEAFDGIDPMMRDLVRQLLLEAIAERGMGIVVSSHNLRELEDLCDRIGVINRKRIVYEADVDDMRINKNKYRVVFGAETEESAVFKQLNCKNIKRDGKIVTFTADGSADAVTGRLMDAGALFVENLPLTLEEIFLIEMEAETYDFKDLFAR